MLFGKSRIAVHEFGICQSLQSKRVAWIEIASIAKVDEGIFIELELQMKQAEKDDSAGVEPIQLNRPPRGVETGLVLLRLLNLVIEARLPTQPTQCRQGEDAIRVEVECLLCQ